MPAKAEQHDVEAVAAYLALVQAQAEVRRRATAQAVAFAVIAAREFRGWYDHDAITEWAAKLAAVIEGMQRGLARSTDAYMARAISTLAGRRIRPVGAVDVAGLRQGVTHAGAYARAADTFRWQQSEFDAIARSLLTGEPRTPGIVDPLEAAVKRAGDVASMDAQLAVRAQEYAAIVDGAERGVVTGHRRVIHPELSKGGTCGLCVAASDRLYGVHELKPIHDRCECTTLPVLNHQDPGSALNRGDLGRLYGHAEGRGGVVDGSGTSREELKRTRYQLDEHGELGLVLNPAGAKVRTELDARRDENRKPRRPQTDEQRAAAVERVRGKLQEALPRVDELAAQDPATWGEYAAKFHVRLDELGGAA